MSAYAEAYKRHFDNFFGTMDYTKAAKAFKAYVVFVIDMEALREHKGAIIEQMEALEAARPIMDFEQLCISESVCRYARKRIKDLEPPKFGAGLSRDPTAEELAEQARLAETYGTSVGDLPNGEQGANSFAFDLRNDDSDDD